MNDLLQITPIPALRQSTAEQMSCEILYAVMQIERRQSNGASMESARGTQIHDVLARYQRHCGQRRVPSDLAEFDQLSKGAGQEATRILIGMRESYQVDFEHLFGTHLKFSLDEDFQATVGNVDFHDLVAGETGERSAYQGEMDGFYVVPEEQRAEVPDFKSHPKPFDPGDTFQAKLYSLAALMMLPKEITSVAFRLIFVRYKNLSRVVIYTRADIPMLIEEVRAQRERQKLIHAKYTKGGLAALEATSGPQCHYCPLLANKSCPMGEANPELQESPEDDLRWLLWAQERAAVVKKRLRNHVQASGRFVTIADNNGRKYQFRTVERESTIYPVFQREGDGIAYDSLTGRPVMPIIEALTDHAHSSPGDASWLPNLTVSSTGLKDKLGAKGRVLLDQAIRDLATTIPTTAWAVKPPAEIETDEGSESLGEELEDWH